MKYTAISNTDKSGLVKGYKYIIVDSDSLGGGLYPIIYDCFVLDLASNYITSSKKSNFHNFKEIA